MRVRHPLKLGQLLYVPRHDDRGFTLDLINSLPCLIPAQNRAFAIRHQGAVTDRPYVTSRGNRNLSSECETPQTKSNNSTFCFLKGSRRACEFTAIFFFSLIFKSAWFCSGAINRKKHCGLLKSCCVHCLSSWSLCLLCQDLIIKNLFPERSGKERCYLCWKTSQSEKWRRT